jgi:hypothetical protein
MTDRTEAMDNLIAQDADLIENRRRRLIKNPRRSEDAGGLIRLAEHCQP